MAMIPKARDLAESSLSGATIRLAQRDAFDRRAATGVPSATGGAPTQLKGPQAPELPAITQTVSQSPAIKAYFAQRPMDDTPIVPFLLRTGRTLEDYDVANQGFVDHAASVIAELAQNDPAWQARADAVGDARQLALRVIAQWQRAHEPDAQGIALPDAIHRSRNTQDVANILDFISAQRRR